MNKVPDDKQSLYWDAIFEIVLELKNQFPDKDLGAVSLGDIFQWTTALPKFADDPELANDDILAAIYQEWYEENNPL